MTFSEPYRARSAQRGDLDALVELFQARDLADVGFVDQARDRDPRGLGEPDPRSRARFAGR
ncbi:MAG TPA: hypothetical protein VFP41_00135 [Actinomycetota bacterium]|nr:hypothetical protein [Actinomycetota bacterium]